MRLFNNWANVNSLFDLTRAYLFLVVRLPKWDGSIVVFVYVFSLSRAKGVSGTNINTKLKTIPC